MYNAVEAYKKTKNSGRCPATATDLADMCLVKLSDDEDEEEVRTHNYKLYIYSIF